MSDSTIAVLVADPGIMGKGIALSFARAEMQLLGPRKSVTGMIEQKDLSGLDTHALAQQELIPILHKSREPSPIVQRKYAADLFVTKTGTRFYDWREMDVPAFRQKTDELSTKILQLLDGNRPPAPPPADDD